MKLLIIGGLHGNERLGVELVALFNKNPITGVDTLIGNPKAVEQNVRYIETDLNRSFGEQTIESLEMSRAKEIVEVAKRYDIVLDFHNTQTPNNNCCFVGQDTQRRLYSIVAQLGFNHCVQATYECINKYASNVISLEISIGDSMDSPEFWYKTITAFSQSGIKAINEDEYPNIYQFLRRVTWAEKEAMALNDWIPFKQLPTKDQRMLHVSPVTVPIFIGSRLTEFYATLLTKM